MKNKRRNKMNDEQIKQIIEETYDKLKENTMCSMLKDFYNKKMLFWIILLWVYFLVFLALAVFSGIKFFKTDLTRYQIMYAAVFVCCIQFFALIKIFAWQMIHRNNIKREIKRLELRIAELTETLKNK